MKNIFFTLTNTTYVNDMNYMHSGFDHRGLKLYCVLIGGLPLNVDWVNVNFGPTGITENTHSEAVQILMEAWTVNHKTDGNPTLLN